MGRTTQRTGRAPHPEGAENRAPSGTGRPLPVRTSTISRTNSPLWFTHAEREGRGCGGAGPAWYFLLVLATCAFVPLFAHGAAADTADDARVVYCLSPAHQAELVDAAVALGVGGRAVGSGHITIAGKAEPLDAWRKQSPKSFDRVCKALYDAAKQGGSGGGGSGGLSVTELLKLLIPVAAGAFLTMLAGDWRGTRDTGMLRADELRRAVREYSSAASAYGEAWAAYSAGPLPSDEAMGRAGAELDAQLRRYELLHTKWRAPGRLRALLAAEPLGDALTTGWGGGTADGRAARSAAIDSALARLRDGCEGLALALERPSRPHPGMKR